MVCYSPYLATSDFHIFGQLKTSHLKEQVWNDEKVIESVKKWLWLQNSNQYQKGYMLLFLVGGKLLPGGWRLWRKMRCVIHPSGYLTSMFKELYNKLLATEELCYKFSGQPSHKCRFRILPHKLLVKIHWIHDWLYKENQVGTASHSLMHVSI